MISDERLRDIEESFVYSDMYPENDTFASRVVRELLTEIAQLREVADSSHDAAFYQFTKPSANDRVRKALSEWRGNDA